MTGKTRALVLRSTSGVLLARLRDDCGLQEVCGLEYFEPNLRYAREQNGLSNLAKLSSGQFTVPFPGPFDLIVSNHQLMHAFRPMDMLRVLRRLIAPHGHLVVYNEDDQDVVFAPHPVPYHWGVVNNFHKQLFTAPTLLNALRLAGFDGSVARFTTDTLMALTTPTDPIPSSQLPRADFLATAQAMRRVGRQFAWMQARSRIAGLTGLRWVKNWLRPRQQGSSARTQPEINR